MDLEINIRVKIRSDDYPMIFEYLSSESNKLRRTRKLLSMAERGMLVAGSLGVTTVLPILGGKNEQIAEIPILVSQRSFSHVVEHQNSDDVCSKKTIKPQRTEATLMKPKSVSNIIEKNPMDAFCLDDGFGAAGI